LIEQHPLEAEVEGFVSDIITEYPKLFIVKVILKGHVGNQKLIVLLDGDEGVTIEQCGKISRSLAAILEEKELFSEKYLLEVSSAGLDFPLQLTRQYKKNVGRDLTVDIDGGDTLRGELVEVNDERIILRTTEKKKIEDHSISFEKINKSMVLVSFK